MAVGRRTAAACALLAAFVLLVTAVCPRGMLRALALSELEGLAEAPAGLVLDEAEPDAEDRLPGVRVSVAREDEEVASDAIARDVVLAGAVATLDERPADDAPPPPRDEAKPPSSASPATPGGDRSPPTVV